MKFLQVCTKKQKQRNLVKCLTGFPNKKLSSFNFYKWRQIIHNILLIWLIFLLICFPQRSIFSFLPFIINHLSLAPPKHSFRPSLPADHLHGRNHPQLFRFDPVSPIGIHETVRVLCGSKIKFERPDPPDQVDVPVPDPAAAKVDITRKLPVIQNDVGQAIFPL